MASSRSPHLLFLRPTLRRGSIEYPNLLPRHLYPGVQKPPAAAAADDIAGATSDIGAAAAAAADAQGQGRDEGGGRHRGEQLRPLSDRVLRVLPVRGEEEGGEAAGEPVREEELAGGAGAAEGEPRAQGRDHGRERARRDLLEGVPEGGGPEEVPALR